MALAQNTSYERYLTGAPSDVEPAIRRGLLLSGGGGDVDEAFRWFIRKAGSGDIVVIRASGADGYNKYISSLGRVDSIESIVTKTPEASRNPAVLQAVRNAEGLFIAGGDQWNYVRLWKGTPLEDAIHHVYAKGGPVGGSSAGLAVLGQHAFSAQFDTVTSQQALADPLDGAEYLIYRAPADGGTFDLRSWRGGGGVSYGLRVENGTVVPVGNAAVY
jgi:cyanophycinase